MQGVVVIDKPSGMTSHDVVDIARRALKIKKIGHAGTLDPLATGVLILLVGKATKMSNQFMGFDKTYQATMQLGLKTVSADIEGEVLEEKTFDHVSSVDIEGAFKKLTGTIDQVPPMVSAVRHKGQRLYKLARQGLQVERPARQVRIDVLDLVGFTAPFVKLYIECSKGTYVRQIADDVGDALGCGACITAIRRTKVGQFTIEQSVNIEELNESHLRDITL